MVKCQKEKIHVFYFNNDFPYTNIVADGPAHKIRPDNAAAQRTTMIIVCSLPTWYLIVFSCARDKANNMVLRFEFPLFYYARRYLVLKTDIVCKKKKKKSPQYIFV